MAQRFAAALILTSALTLSACSAVGVATTAVGVGVGVASTGVRVGVGATARAADLVIPDGDACKAEERAEDTAEGEDCQDDE